MIIFDLKCQAQGHVFEAWFGSNEDYEAQRERGLVACPICGDKALAKAPMAPAVGAKGNRQEPVKTMLGELAKAQKQALENSEHVGARFPDEARAIHLGETEARAIHGRASPADADALREEGVPIAPLPFPIVDPSEQN